MPNDLQQARISTLFALRKTVLIASLAACVQGCVVGMQDFAGLKADKGLATGSIPAASRSAAGGYVAEDSRAITEALARAESSDSQGLKWENPDSGAHGLITSFAEKKEEGGNCLAFETTRENFDGIHLYQGLACKDPAGVLRLRELEAL